MMMTFWVSDFYETFICYRRYFNLYSYIGKKNTEHFPYGFKNLVKLGVQNFFLKIIEGRTVFRKLTPNLTITRGNFESNFEVF